MRPSVHRTSAVSSFAARTITVSAQNLKHFRKLLFLNPTPQTGSEKRFSVFILLPITATFDMIDLQEAYKNFEQAFRS